MDVQGKESQLSRPISDTVNGLLGAGYSGGSWDVNLLIDALAQDQLISILAEPNLVAQSGETASFLAGGEFPVRSRHRMTG